MDTRKVAVLGAGNSNVKSTIANVLEKERGIEIVNIDKIKDDKIIFADSKEVGILPESNEVIFENSDLINEQAQINKQLLSQEPYLIRNYHDPIDEIYLTDRKVKRTDGQRLKEYGIDSLDKLLEECILISQKQSKLPRSIRDIIVRISVEAFKELNVKAEEIKKESHNLTSLEEAKDQILGEIGTERRDDYEKELKESLENNTKEDDRKEQ